MASPAPAGMDLCCAAPGARHRRFPRARGDGPFSITASCRMPASTSITGAGLATPRAGRSSAVVTREASTLFRSWLAYTGVS